MFPLLFAALRQANAFIPSILSPSDLSLGPLFTPVRLFMVRLAFRSERLDERVDRLPEHRQVRDSLGGVIQQGRAPLT